MNDKTTILNENYYINPENQFFYDCSSINKKLTDQNLNIYKYKLLSADFKLRFTVLAYENLVKYIEGLEVGEFIYFSDQDRLSMSFYLESFLIFARTTFDLAISSYYIYFQNKSNLDSLNDFIKKIKNDSSWLPQISSNLWNKLISDYDAKDFNWINTLVGASSGVSLRDKAVHKGLLQIDTYINDCDKGCFILHLNAKEVGYLYPWILNVKSSLFQYLFAIRNDIKLNEYLTVLK